MRESNICSKMGLQMTTPLHPRKTKLLTSWMCFRFSIPHTRSARHKRNLIGSNSALTPTDAIDHTSTILFRADTLSRTWLEIFLFSKNEARRRTQQKWHCVARLSPHELCSVWHFFHVYKHQLRQQQSIMWNCGAAYKNRYLMLLILLHKKLKTFWGTTRDVV